MSRSAARPAALTACILSLALAAPRPRAESELLPRGWLATFRAGDASATAHAPNAAFALEADQAPHPSVATEGWTATWTARVEVKHAGRHRFGVEAVQGAATVDVGGTTAVAAAGEAAVTGWTPWVELERGAVDVAVTFQPSVHAGARRLRTMWERERDERGGFRPEPIPSRFTSIRPEDADAARAALDERGGRLLLETKGCTSCHAPPAGNAVGVRAAPDLVRVTERAGASWLERWIADPAAVRAHADMPRVPGAAEEARDVLAFLRSLAGQVEEAETDMEGADRERGRELYHQVGCIACHGALASPAELFHDEFLPGRVPDAEVPAPLGDLAGKWRAPALAAFLADPRASHPDGRMPSLELEADEARDLAAYLVEAFGAALDEAPDDPAANGDAARGREAFTALGCQACHALEGLDASAAAPALVDLDPERGCLDPGSARTPRYDLDEGETGLLRRGLEAARNARDVRAPLDEAERALERLACTACHVLDGRGGPAEDLRIYFVSLEESADLGDEGRLAPELSGAGFKLTTSWLDAVLTDAGRARPYLAMRMPQFGEACVGELAGLLARREGVVPHADVDAPEATDERVLTGRSLMGLDAIACSSCHVYKDYPPSGTSGPDVTAFAERLRFEWWRAFVQDPARYKPGTRMPSFSTAGVSTMRDVYDGDLDRQAEALWAYFTLGGAMPPPAGVEPARALNVVVGERPVVLRTFLEDVGPRAIAVGNPNGLHYAFDARTCRLAQAWQGEFLDASAAWAGRGGLEAGGRGPLVWTAPEGLCFELVGADGAPIEATPRFRGYRLDADGHPTFLYEVAGASVAESVHGVVHAAPVIRRELAIEGLPDDARVRVPALERTLEPPPGGGPLSITIEVTP